MSKAKKTAQSFISRNLVTIVMIPSIVGLHFGWSLIQNNRQLVPEGTEVEMPPIKFAKFCWRKLTMQSTALENNENEIK